MDSHQSILAKISILQKKMEVLRENEKKLVVAEIRKLVGMYGIQPAELFSDTKPGQAATRKRGTRTGKRAVSPKPPKYQDPATGKTWNGHGKRPFWLVGDREAYLITAQDAAAIALKPKKRTRGKQAAGKAGAAKAAKKTAPTTRAKKSSAAPKRVVKRRTVKKAAAPAVSAPPPPKPATPSDPSAA